LFLSLEDDRAETPNPHPGGFSFRDARGCFKKSRDLGVFLKKRRGAGAEPRCVSS